MRKVKGYVIIASTWVVEPETNQMLFLPSFQVLYGQSINNKPYLYENITSNGIIPYHSIKELKKGLENLKEEMGNKFHTFSKATIEMKIAETNKELEQLKEKKSLVTIKKEYGNVNQFVGPQMPSCLDLYPIPGAYLNDNLLTPFTEFERANYSAKESSRQGDRCGASVAEFKIKRLD